MLYRRHPQSLYLEGVPEEICKKYSQFSYCYVEVDGFDEIPVPKFSINGLKYHKIDIYDIPIEEYANGFLKGYSSDLVPYLDTLENRKDELYKQLIGKGGRGFQMNVSSEGITTVLKKDCYESGIFEGKRYKAWEIVFESPKQYLEWFQPKNKIKSQMGNFYEDVKHHVLTHNWKIGETEFPLIDYIEERHKEAPYKGKIFYANLSKCMGAMPKHFGVELFPKIFKETIEYCGRKQTEIESPAPQQTETETGQEQPKTFAELFYDANFISPCIDILKEIEPPLIDTECNYIGNLKGAFCVWIDEMQRQGIVKHFSDRKIFASLLPQKIKRFSIDESMFGKPQSKAENKYRTDMKTLLSQIKLSQNSQKGKLGK